MEFDQENQSNLVIKELLMSIKGGLMLIKLKMQ